jgi:hypothetical protein
MASTPCSVDVWHPSRTRWTDSRPRPRGRLRARPLARSSAVPPGVPPSWSASGELDLAAPHPGHGSGPGRAERAPPIVVGGDWRRRRALVRWERDSRAEWGGDGHGKAEDALGTCGKREREIFTVGQTQLGSNLDRGTRRACSTGQGRNDIHLYA